MNCIECGNILHGKQLKFCQKKCEYKNHDSKRRIRVIHNCRICDVPVGDSGLYYCSKECRYIWWKNKKHPKENNCRNCGKPNAGKGYRYCTDECRRKYWVKHEIKNRKTINEYLKRRRKTDDMFRLRVNLSDRVRKCLRSRYMVKDKTLRDILGCSVYELKEYLASKFVDGMSWDNYGDWHIDHMIPLASAETKEDIYRLWHYTNLQPLWAKDNLKKGSKLIY